MSAPVASVTPWQSDPDVQAIHSAFILGWSLVELRGRVQLAALDATNLPPAAASAPVGAADAQDLVRGPNERLLRSSQIRTLFRTIITLQRARFPDIATAGTLYDPPQPTSLPYLYPVEAPDYAEIGISSLGSDPTGAPVWAAFRLYDVARRAINCLTLLLGDPQDSLVPDFVAGIQHRLTADLMSAEDHGGAEVLGASPDAGDSPAAVPSLAATMIQALRSAAEPSDGSFVLGAALGDTPAPAQPTDHGKAITVLSFLCVRMLQSWDGLLRERFASEGVGSHNLLTLIAYEAGRNLAGLSWMTSVNAIQLEAQADEGAGAGLGPVWHSAFTGSGLNQALQQIGALSASLDDAYYRGRERPAALGTASSLDDLLIRPDPARPSQVIGAVRESVVYWQRTVVWLTGDQAHDNPMALADWRRLRTALIDQSGVWFNLMTGQQDLRGFSADRITSQIMDEALGSLRDLARRDLPAAFQQASQQIGDVAEVVTGAVGTLSDAATKEAKRGIDKIFHTVSPFLWLIIGLSVATAAGLIVYAFISGRADGLVGIATSLFTAVAGALGIHQGGSSTQTSQQEVGQEIDKQRATATKTIHQQQGSLQSSLSGTGSQISGAVSGAFGQAGSFLVEAYEKGLARIQIELQTLNYSVSVARPLVEFFVRRNDVRSDLDFLTTVVWDSSSREAQLRNVVTAAFGPISILLGGSAEGDPPAAK